MSYTFSRTWRANQAHQAESRHWGVVKCKLLEKFPESEVAKWTYKEYIEHQLEMKLESQRLAAARLRELESQHLFAKADGRPPLKAFPGKSLTGNTAAVHGGDVTVFCIEWAPLGKYIVPWPEYSAWEYEGEKRRYTPYGCNFNRMMPMLREISNDTVAWYKCREYYAPPLDLRFRKLNYEDIYHPPEPIELEETNPWLQGLIEQLDDEGNEVYADSPPRSES